MLTDEWELLSIEEIPEHKVKRYKFISNDHFILNGYRARRCIDLHISIKDVKDDDSAAWSKLDEKLKEDKK